jgi:hypothetical protein
MGIEMGHFYTVKALRERYFLLYLEGTLYPRRSLLKSEREIMCTYE